jgi:phage regulator Rha-like protein
MNPKESLLTTTEALTMTSREIAVYTGKEHFHIMRDLGKMFAEMGDEGGASRFGSSYISEQGKLMPMLRLPKRETMILISGYSVTLRAKIVDRWQELEAQVAQPVPTTLTGALRLALAQAEELEAKNAQIASQTKLITEIRPAATVGAMVAAHKHSLDQVARTFPGVDTRRVKQALDGSKRSSD